MSKAVIALKIGRAKYRVRYRRLLPDLYGRMCFTTRSIFLDDGHSGVELADTLLHEILHVLWGQKKLPPRTSEERVVKKLAQGLAQVFQDNPGLLGHIERLVKQGR